MLPNSLGNIISWLSEDKICLCFKGCDRLECKS